MNSTPQDTNTSIPVGGNAAHSRYEELPRYLRWQNALRPEDTGHSDGLAGIPSQTDTASHFEGQVRDYLNSRLARARNEFTTNDATFAGAILTLRPEYTHFKQLLDEKRAATRRPVIIRLNGRTGKLAIALATMLSAALMFILWHDKGIRPIVGTAISLCGAVLASLTAYPCGLTLRQATQQWQKWLSAATLAVLTCVLLATAINMLTPSFQPMERGVIGVMIAFAFLTVAACVFLMHDQDAAYADLERRAGGLHQQLSQLDVQRAENRVFHTNVARRHVEIARRMISAYRQANVRTRPGDAPAPTFFSELPGLPEIQDDWLAYLGTEQS